MTERSSIACSRGCGKRPFPDDFERLAPENTLSKNVRDVLSPHLRDLFPANRPAHLRI